MKKIIVNEEACIGCGACVSIAPLNFDFGDQGLSHVKSNDDVDSKEVMDAISSCPTAAISISDCECSECECSECHCGEEE